MKQTLTETLAAPQEDAARRATRLPAAVVQTIYQLLSIILLLGLWLWLSQLMSTKIIPTPWATWQAILRAVDDGYLWQDMLTTFSRTLGAFALAMLLGTVSGFLLGSVRWFNRIFGSWLTIAASIPSLLYIVVAYLAVGLNDTAAIIGAGLIVAPSITYNVWQGMKTLDPQLRKCRAPLASRVGDSFGGYLAPDPGIPLCGRAPRPCPDLEDHDLCGAV